MSDTLRTSRELLVNRTHTHVRSFCKTLSYGSLSGATCPRCVKSGLKWTTLQEGFPPFTEPSGWKTALPSLQGLRICTSSVAGSQPQLCVEAVLLNGGLVANWLLLQSGLWLCPWVIKGAVKREPLEQCQWTHEGMPARCRPTRESAARDVQIPERQRPCKRWKKKQKSGWWSRGKE